MQSDANRPYVKCGEHFLTDFLGVAGFSEMG